ncbi:unnamed protein product [Camellia sinensis]
MDQLFSHLSADFPHSHFLRVEAEEQPEISEPYSVSAVPYFVFLKVTEKDIVFCLDGKTVDSLEDADPSSLANKVAKIAGSIAHGEPAAPASLGMAAGPTILEIVTLCLVERFGKRFGKGKRKGKDAEASEGGPVMLHCGTPDVPRCGFSSKVVDALRNEGVSFGSFDILSDDEVRQGLKTSN